MRYRLHHHPAFPNLLSKDDLYILVERGSLTRGDLCTDMGTGLDHTVGEIVGTMRPPRGHAQARISRPAYQEIRADLPHDADDEGMSTDEGADDDADDAFTESGERILFHTHPSWFAYSKALFLALLLAVSAGMLFVMGGGYFWAAAGACIVVLSSTAMARFTHDCLVTEERIEVMWGIIGRSSCEVRICDIRSIDVRQSGLKGLFGLGTVDFSSSANAGVEVQFRDIRHAHDLKQLVRRLQKEASED